jgi:uncharacterized protein YegL
MKNFIIAVILIAVTAAGVFAYPMVSKHIDPPVNTTPITTTTPSKIVPVSNPMSLNEPKVEVVFVLDTTGSMSGLIQAAKDNIWSIASSMASAEPAPIIRMGLVAYRDRGDDYVTRVVDLSDDLDTNYGTLMSFQAGGGGDAPESVNKALYDAVTDISWSQDDNTYRVIFLVGDAPPKMNYADEMQYPEIIQLAREKGIIINAIQAGNMAMTAQPWKHIARLGYGEFFTVAQSGNAVAVSTPYDEQIASLSRELDDTRLFYGNKEVKARKRAKVAATEKFNREAAPASVARKAEFNVSLSGARNFSGDHELVSDIAEGRVKLDAIVEEELPTELQSLGRAEQMELIEEKAAKRDELKQQIAELSSKRGSYVLDELEESGADKDSLDNKIYQTVRKQAADKGLVYNEEKAKY